MPEITVHDLTIRQAKKLGKEVGVKGWSKLNVADLVEAIKMAQPDASKLQKMVDELLAPEAQKNGHSKKRKAEEEDDAPPKYGDASQMSKKQLEEARLEALTDIAKAAGKRNRIEEKLRALRETLNQEVAEAKANLKGAMERSVDYDNADQVREKLAAVAEAWQGHEDALEHRRLELEPLKEQLSKAKTTERRAFEDSRQLKIKF